MATFQKSFFCTVVPVLTLLALSACAESPTNANGTANDPQVGRFVIVHVPGSTEVVEIDTATGKTWRLMWSNSEEGRQAFGWEPIEDYQ